MSKCICCKNEVELDFKCRIEERSYQDVAHCGIKCPICGTNYFEEEYNVNYHNGMYTTDFDKIERIIRLKYDDMLVDMGL